MKIRKGILLVLSALLLTGCAGKQVPQQTAAAVTVPAATEVIPVATEPIPETTQAVPETTRPAEPVLHSGIREDGTFDEHTVFMGDSLTYGLVEHELKVTGDLGDAWYLGKCGAHVGIYTDGTRMVPDDVAICYYSEEFRGMTMPEALRTLGGDVHAIYYMFGTNYDPEGTAQDYIEVLDDILEACPNATVYLQTVLQGDAAWITINERILEAAEHYAREPRVQLMDTGGTIGRHVINDGIHQTPFGRQLWVRAIRDYAEANNIPQ